LPGAPNLAIYGYTADGSAPSRPGGPVLIVDQGATVNLTLANNLAAPTALTIVGVEMAPDLDGVAPGASRTYTFTAAQPGTYLYEAGLIPGGARQVALGLYGALIVRPAGAPSQLYDAASAFDDEAVLVFSEIDPRLNANPAGFDLRDFQPQYFLINGQVYPGADVIPTAAGRTLALRYINAGLHNRTVGLLGVDQSVVGLDGLPLAFPRGAMAESVAPGASVDALVRVPAAAPAGTRYPLFDTGLTYLHNPGQPDPGGPLTLVTVDSAVTPAPVGPLARSVQVTPNPTTGLSGVTLSAVLSSSSANVVAAEYFIDTLGAPGTGTAFAGLAPGASASVSAFINAATLATLAPDSHPLFVRGQDANGVWGPVNSAILDLVTTGPIVSSLNLRPGGLDLDGLKTSPTRGDADVRLYGTASTGHEDASGAVTVTTAQYAISGPGLGAPVTGAVDVTPPGVNTAALSAVIPASAVNGLTPAGVSGVFTVSVTAQDSLGNTGAAGVVSLYLDKQGPAVQGAPVVRLTPNNGTLPVDTFSYAVRVDATFTDPLVNGVQSNIDWAELYIGQPGQPGTGAPIPFYPTRAVFSSPSEPAYATIPLATVNQLAQGAQTLYLRGRDAAGNWGPYTQATLVVDKAGPVITGLALANTATPRVLRLSGTATDAAVPGATGSTIMRAEWFRGTDPGLGLGTAIPAADGVFNSPSELVAVNINTNGWAAGAYVISARAQDQAGNWGLIATRNLTITTSGARIFAADFAAGSFTDWTAAYGLSNSQLSVTTPAGEGALAAGDGQLEARVKGAFPAYLVDRTPYDEATYGASFQFQPADAASLAGGAVDIFTGLDRQTTLFGVQYQRTGSGHALRFYAVDAAGNPQATAWQPISAGPHQIEVIWQAGAEATLTFSVDGAATRLTLDTAGYGLDEVRLGLQGEGLQAGMSGALYFDNFSSSRQPYNVYLPALRK
ncbi:MAG: multicopper oxidase domain-containing protein, partial [Anaerolineales bacterium]|nr:multicopper oxidase domain-containing protein [Anaerolineales bacterium]